MADKLTYAKVDGPPDDWFGLLVVDLATGTEVADVYEVNSTEGWLIRAARNAAGELYTVGEGNDAGVAMERVEGQFEIRRPA